MKRMIPICVFLLLPIHVFCQHYIAEKISTSTFIVTKYSRCEDGGYNEGKYAFVGREIMLNDSMYYFVNSRTDKIIQENKYLLTDLGGNIDDYEPVFYSSKEHSIENDLSICPFDSAYYVLGKLEFNVYSKNGFFKKNDSSNDLFAIYCFDGEIILYKWEDTSTDNESARTEVHPETIDNCGCPKHDGVDKHRSFVILQKTNRVSRYDTNMENAECFQPTSVNRIELYYCE